MVTWCRKRGDGAGMSTLVARALVVVTVGAGLMAGGPGTSPAQSADCVALDPAQLAFDAPQVQSAEGGCFSLPSAEGDVLLAHASHQVSIVDAAGQEQCSIGDTGVTRCVLAGTAPYATVPSTARMRLARLNDPQGCGTFSPATFGAPATEPLSLTLEYDDFGCERGAVPAGRSRMLPPDYTPWAWFDGAGGSVCSGTASAVCEMAQAGQVTVVLAASSRRSLSGAVVPLGQTSGCVDASTSWADPATSVEATGPEVACLSFPASAGERVLPAVEQPSETTSQGEVVDAGGAPVCAADGLLGCELTGAPPYRYLTWGPTSTYRATVRDVTGMTGCPTLRATAFGVTAGDVFPRVGCRRLAPAASAAFVVKPSTGWYDGIYAPTGERRCADTTWTCSLEGGQPSLLVIDPLGVSFRTSFHRLDGTSCQTTLKGGVAGQWDGSISARQVDCVRLSYPTGAAMSLLPPADYSSPLVDVVDADGALQCRLTSRGGGCRLAGRAPYRALAWDDVGRRYHVVLPRLDKAVGCQPLVHGDWGTSRGSVITLPKGRVAGCVKAPGAVFRGWNLLGWQRLAGRGDARVFAQDERSSCEVEGDQVRGVATCVSATPVPAVESILLSTDRSGGRWRIVHRNPEDSAGCVTARGRRPRSRATTGTLRSPVQFDCVDLPAAADEEFVAHFDGRDHRATMQVYPTGGLDRLCGTVYSEDCRFSGFDGYRLVTYRETYAARDVPYRVEPVRIRVGSAWDSRCARYPDYSSGFGPRTLTLSNRRAVDCVVVEDLTGFTRYDVTSSATDGSDRLAIPFAVSALPQYPADCAWASGVTYRCSGFTASGVDDGDSGLILVSRFKTGQPLPYRLRGRR